MDKLDKKIRRFLVDEGYLFPITDAEIERALKEYETNPVEIPPYLDNPLIFLKMDKLTDIVTDTQVELAWGNANFGDVQPRDIIANTLLKCASGYATGRTARVICEELGLVTGDWQLSQRGKAYLFAAYSGGLSL